MDIQEQFNEVRVDLAGIKKDVKSLEIRMGQQDEFNTSMREVATSVQLMAQNMKQMLDRQTELTEITKENGKEIQALKLVPAKKWNTISAALLTGIVGTILGYFADKILSLM